MIRYMMCLSDISDGMKTLLSGTETLCRKSLVLYARNKIERACLKLCGLRTMMECITTTGYLEKLKGEMEGRLGCKIEVVEDGDSSYPCKMR